MPILKGSSGGNDYEICAGIAGIGTEGIAYFNTNCGRKNCFYCNIGNFKHFQMNGLCPLKEGKLCVLKPKVIVNGHPIWKGFASSINIIIEIN